MVCKGRICLFANSCKWLCKAICGVYLSIHCAIECSVLQRLCKSYAGTFQTLPKNAEKRPVWAAFLILIQHAKHSDFPRFSTGQHPKNGFISPFAGKNSFLKPHALQNLILRDPSHPQGRAFLQEKGRAAPIRKTAEKNAPAAKGRGVWVNINRSRRASGQHDGRA